MYILVDVNPYTGKAISPGASRGMLHPWKGTLRSKGGETKEDRGRLGSVGIPESRMALTHSIVASHEEAAGQPREPRKVISTQRAMEAAMVSGRASGFELVPKEI